MPDPIAGILGLCRKAGRLAMGFDSVKDALFRGSAELVLVASDSSERTRSSIAAAANETGTTIRALPMTLDEVGFAISKRAGVLAVCDSGFARKITELLDGREAVEGPQTAQAGEELH